jgi:threonine aldolase
MTVFNSIIDLRSDTVTKPTREMIDAMSRAELGDDFFRDDPTVIALEELAAGMLGHETAMLVLSGTMGNLVSVLTLSARGQSFIAEETAHLLINESGWAASLAGLTAKPVRGVNGVLSPARLAEAIAQSQNKLTPPLGVVCLENTHNAAGGRVMTADQTRELVALARQQGLKIHLDGARIFNAAIACGEPVSRLVEGVDTVTFCLSKGLSCPAGSIVAGATDVIAQARRWRQTVGGGMRQAGIIAAAGLVALKSMADRLAEDHQTARLFARKLFEAGLSIEPEAVETNIVFVGLPDEDFDKGYFHSDLLARGIKINPPRGNRIRAVTHRGVTALEAGQAADRFIAAYHAALGRRGRVAAANMDVATAVY